MESQSPHKKTSLYLIILCEVYIEISFTNPSTWCEVKVKFCTPDNKMAITGCHTIIL